VIIERGTPAELEAVEGHYSDLIKMQLEGQFEGS